MDHVYPDKFLEVVTAHAIAAGTDSRYRFGGSCAGGAQQATLVVQRLLESVMWRNTTSAVSAEISLPPLSTVWHHVSLQRDEAAHYGAAAEQCCAALRWAVQDSKQSMAERQHFRIRLELPTQVCYSAVRGAAHAGVL